MNKRIILGIVLLLLIPSLVTAIDCGFKAENMVKILIPLDKPLVCEGTAISFNNITGGVLNCNNYEVKGKVIIKDSKDFEIINCDFEKDQLIISNLNNSEKKISGEILRDINKDLNKSNKKIIVEDIEPVDMINTSINDSDNVTKAEGDSLKNDNFKNAYKYQITIFVILLIILLFLIFFFFSKNKSGKKSSRKKMI